VLKAPVWEYNTTLAGWRRRNQPKESTGETCRWKVFWPQMMAFLLQKQDLRGNSWATAESKYLSGIVVCRHLNKVGWVEIKVPPWP